MKKKSLLSLLFVWILLPILGQERRQNSCLFEEVQPESYEQNPKAQERAIEFQKIVKLLAQLKRRYEHSKTEGNYIIPVGFRIHDAKFPNDSDGNVINVTDFYLTKTSLTIKI